MKIEIINIFYIHKEYKKYIYILIPLIIILKDKKSKTFKII